jgi:hypothetical protein
MSCVESRFVCEECGMVIDASNFWEHEHKFYIEELMRK